MESTDQVMTAATEHRTISGLGKTLRAVGAAEVLLALLSLVLAFTGYETPKAVNTTYLLTALPILVLGLSTLSAGRAFRRAAGVPGPSCPGVLVDALDRLNKVQGFVFVLLALAILGLGYNTIEFLVGIIRRG